MFKFTALNIMKLISDDKYLLYTQTRLRTLTSGAYKGEFVLSIIHNHSSLKMTQTETRIQIVLLMA